MWKWLTSEKLTHNANTMIKVREALREAGLQWHTINDAINQMQNRGILFRERVK